MHYLDTGVIAVECSQCASNLLTCEGADIFRVPNQDRRGGSPGFDLELGQDAISILVQVAEIVQGLAVGFVNFRAGDERQFFVNVTNPTGMSRTAVPSNEAGDVSAPCNQKDIVLYPRR